MNEHDRENDEEKQGEQEPWHIRLVKAFASQITLVSISVTFTLTLTLVIAFVVVNNTDIFQLNGGWTVSQSSTTTSFGVVIDSQLEVKDDVSITGSVLEMAASDCANERRTQGMGTICFDEAENEFKVSQSGGQFIDLRGEQGLTGPQGPAGLQGEEGLIGEQGESGQDGLNCWDLNGNGIREREEDTNGDGRLDTTDCRSLVLLTGQTQQFTLGPNVCIIEIPETAVNAVGGEALLPINGNCQIVLSERFAEAAAQGRLNVQLTPQGKPAILYFSISLRIPLVIVNGQADGEQQFHYLIQVLE